MTTPLSDGQALEFRDRTLHVHHRPGHSPSDTVFHDRERRILIAADHLLAHVSSNPLITRPRGGSGERPKALIQYPASLAATREVAQALWGNIAVTQAYLTLSEVLGHLDLLVNEGRAREVTRDDVSVWAPA